MVDPILATLRNEGLLDHDSCNRIEEGEKSKLFSLFWHLKSLLYLGVTVLVAGSGIVIYKNIDTIGHLTIVVLIGLVSAGCYYYCIKKGTPFSREKSESPGIGYDYILLLGSLLFLTLLAYLQWQYHVFGKKFGLATFFPAFILLLTAYRFDHLGVLTMGIALFSSWLGISVTPFDILRENDFSSASIVFTGAGLAIFYGFSGYFHEKKKFKSHFSFTFYHFAVHLAGISCLAGLFTFHLWIIWLVLLACTVFIVHRFALRIKSFYLVFVSLVYGYIGSCYFAFQVLKFFPETLAIYIGMTCFIAGSVMLIRYLKETKKSFSNHDTL